MKKNVTIARALKEKNRLAGRLAQIRALIGKENSREKNVPRGIDVQASFEVAKVLKQRLVDVKAAIAAANKPIVAKIVELDEMKAEIAWLNGLETREGVFKQANYGGIVTEEYDAVIKKADLLEELKKLQKRADELQDALDEFNASTKVEIEMDD